MAIVEKPVVIAQFSDLHLTVEGRRNSYGIDTAAALSRCIAHLAGLARRRNTSDCAPCSMRCAFRFA
jgi:3',5'-cyclic AMP phosphodiesterase CpdA